MPAAKKTSEKTATTPPADDARPAYEGLWAKVGWVTSKVRKVEKTGEVSFGKTSFKHFQEHGLFEVLNPLLEQIGLTVAFPGVSAWEKNGNESTLTLRMLVFDPESGESDLSEWVNIGVDSSDKGYNKAYTGASKYALQKFFRIKTEGLDENETVDQKGEAQGRSSGATAAARIPAEIATQLRLSATNLIADKKVASQHVKNKLRTFGVDKIDDLTGENAETFSGWLVEKSQGEGR